MDITVKTKDDGQTWTLTDLLGRSMGVIAQNGNEFTVIPDGHALETMDSMSRGPFPSLDAALAKIEKHTRGTCRMAENRQNAAAIQVDRRPVSNDE